MKITREIISKSYLKFQMLHIDTKGLYTFCYLLAFTFLECNQLTSYSLAKRSDALLRLLLVGSNIAVALLAFASDRRVSG